MNGQFYSTGKDAIRAFQCKNLFNKVIVFNEDNPSEKDFDFGTELFKVLNMANYYSWLDLGILQIIGFQRESELKKFIQSF